MRFVSSNPLQPDPRSRNASKFARELADEQEPASSDDPLQIPVKDYQQHISSLFPEYIQPMEVQDEEMNETFEEEEEEQEDQGDDIDMESDEEMSIMKRPPEEREEIENELRELQNVVSTLHADYRLVDRLGTGTFSSVYKAVDLGYHDKWDNRAWLGHHPESSSAHYQSVPKPPSTKVFVAIKRIYVTSNPERIRNEISILTDCRSCRHVSQLITAFRQEDQVVAIMPYHRNDDFRDFYRELPMAGIKQYFRCLFRALSDIHARRIIHRDVKPANFLFDCETYQGTLCDFGLACRFDSATPQTLGSCFHTPPTVEHPHGRVLSRNDYNAQSAKQRQHDARALSQKASEKVGYPANDTRPTSKANRAGTRGFRAPEVLFKCSEQSGAIDVWAAGIILLFFLTGKFPLFQSSDDNEALMELAVILGRKKIEKAATLHSRTFATNVPSVNEEGTPWSSFVLQQNPDLYERPKSATSFDMLSENDTDLDGQMNTDSMPPVSSSSPSHSPSSPGSKASVAFSNSLMESHKRDVDLAFSLLNGLLEPEAHKRFTPKLALAHDFLRDEGPDDQDTVPHPFGVGVCAKYHFIDEVTEELFVKVFEPLQPGQTIRRLGTRGVAPGEGIAIGRSPCEFHQDSSLYG
ncbi:Kinase-like protein [Mycena indigotica]|uniref:non-specific serine/threonine protein kinase n=1 Tax=Mycena indigotica TaxID=2126181 RepID=A0A8H6SWW4_9AGAR|nr:Kinase-like protein [Mycena indigotica]KAF7306773.1 Kinase-like protein [Mycena indigotica]